MPTPLVAGNWKMNLTPAEAVALVRELREPLAAIDGVTRVICPPFVALQSAAAVLAGTPVHVGAQNMHPEPKGAFTGEVSAPMLQGLCDYVIVGHSERRHVFGEGDDLIGRKVTSAIRSSLIPILCIGETSEERDGGKADSVCQRQLQAGLAGLTEGETAQVVVAYEPVWAIGTGRSATPELAQEIMGAVRAELRRIAGDAAANVPLLYGGSVTPDNAAAFAAQPDIDGALVGGASLKAASFVPIVAAFAA